MKTIEVSLLSMPAIAYTNLEQSIYRIEQCMNKVVRQLRTEGTDIRFGWHIDIMDGKYVPAIAMDAKLIAAVLETVSMPANLHFMVQNLEPYQDIVKTYNARMFLHLNTDAVIDKLNDGAKLDLAINPDEPVNSSILDECQNVLIMSVMPGKGGQKYMPVSDRIAAVKAYNASTGKQLHVTVDGGINADTICNVTDADAVVVGSAIMQYFRNDEAMFNAMLEIAKAYTE